LLKINKTVLFAPSAFSFSQPNTKIQSNQK